MQFSVITWKFSRQQNRIFARTTSWMYSEQIMLSARNLRSAA